MEQSMQGVTRTNWPASILGILAAVIIYFVLTGRKLPLISSERAGLIAIIAIGFVMCTVGGIGKTINVSVGWTHPINLLGYLLGALIIIVTAVPFLKTQLFWVISDKSAILTIGILGLAKWLNAMVFYLFFDKPA